MSKDYQQTKGYIKNAIQNQVEGSGFSFVEVITVCNDLTFTDPVDFMDWVREIMMEEFPLGEFKAD